MLNFVLRRIQRFILPIKIAALVLGLTLQAYLIFQVPPGVGTIVVFSIILFVVSSLVFSFFLTPGPALLTATAISFFLFLKAVSLLSPLNIGLFVVFIILLGLYLRKG